MLCISWLCNHKISLQFIDFPWLVDILKKNVYVIRYSKDLVCQKHVAKQRILLKKSVLKYNQTCVIQFPPSLLPMTLWLTWKFPPGFVLITECGLKIRWVSARVQACVNNPVCSLYCVARCTGTAGRTHHSICVLSMRYYFARTKLSVVCAQPQGYKLHLWMKRQRRLFVLEVNSHYMQAHIKETWLLSNSLVLFRGSELHIDVNMRRRRIVCDTL